MAAITTPEPTARPKRAVIYLRISEDDGSREGVDLRQRPDCEAYCQKQGWDVVAVVDDNDISASRYARKRRPGYQSVLRMVDDGEADAIVAWHLDRLWRQPRELEDLIDRATYSGLTVATLNGDIDLRTSDGKFQARILVNVAAKASDDASNRILRQKLQRRSEGRPTGGAAAFGWQDGMQVNEAEAQLIREAAEAVLAGASVVSVARDWNHRGVKPPQGGKGWTATSVKVVLTSPRNAGLVGFRRIGADGKRAFAPEAVGEAAWPAIVDRVTFERLRAVIDGRAATPQTVRPHHAHLLTGLVRCDCGAVMARDTQNGQRVWRCRNNHHNPGRPACGKVSILAEPVEEMVTGAVFVAVDTPKLGQMIDRRPDDGGVEAELADIERQMDELADMFARGSTSARQFERMNKTLMDRAEAARGRMHAEQSTSALAPYAGQSGRLRAAWDGLSLEQRRQVLAAAIDHVTITPATTRGRYSVHADRVNITWRA
jgi:DNA invertase Pin-like site-specific DNA recombinase